MTLKEFYEYFGSANKFAKQTGLSRSNVSSWKKIGYIPISMQHRIEQFTEGKLKADYNNVVKNKKGAKAP